MCSGCKDRLHHFKIEGDVQHCGGAISLESEISFKYIHLYVGYSKETKCGLFYDTLMEIECFISTNVIFLKNDHIKNHQPHSKLILNEIYEDTTDKLTKVVNKVGPSSKLMDIASIFDPPHLYQELRMSRRSERVIHQSNHYLGLTKT